MSRVKCSHQAVVKTALNNGYEIFGIENGFNGLVTGRMGLMDYKDVSGILPRGGTILGTTNRDNPFKFAVEENGELVYYDNARKYWLILKNMVLKL